MLISKIINKKIIIFLLFYFLALNHIYSDNLEYLKAKDAIRAGNVNELLKYFQSGLNPLLTKGKEYKNIFHIALESGNIEIIELFLIQNIELNYNHPHIGYPLYFACKQNNEKLVKLLLDYGADPFIMENEDHEDFSYFIYIAIYDGNNLFLKTCLELGYDPNYLNVNITDDTPLIISIKRSNIETMKLLIQYGAKINIVNDLNNFMTPLSIATKRYGENSNYVKILKENNALNLKYKFSVKTYGSSTTNRLRVREKPTLDADVVGHLMEGDIIEMIEVTPLAYTIDDMLFPWVRIKNNEISGWVFAGYIKLHTDNYGA